MPPSFHLLCVMLAQPFENISRRHAWPRIGESFLHLLTQPLIKFSLLPIEGALRRAKDLSRRSLSAGFYPGRHTFLKVAKGDGKRAACARHRGSLLPVHVTNVTLSF